MRTTLSNKMRLKRCLLLVLASITAGVLFTMLSYSPSTPTLDYKNLLLLDSPRPDQTMQELVLYWDGPVADKTAILHGDDDSQRHRQRLQSKTIQKLLLVQDGTHAIETALLHSSTDNRNPLLQVQPKSVQELVLQWDDGDASETALHHSSTDNPNPLLHVQPKSVQELVLQWDDGDASETALHHSSTDNRNPLPQVQPKSVQELVLQWDDGEASKTAVLLESSLRREDSPTKLLNTPATRSPLLFFNLSAPNVNFSNYDVTLVSAYIDLENIVKGETKLGHDQRQYETWSQSFSKIFAPLIFFTDSLSFAEHMRHVRANLSHLTEIVLVNRSRLWAFRQRESIARIYAGDYPKHWPNTVYPDYTCLTHAKFDFLMEALETSRFPPTPHLAWMDVGYLRDVASAPNPAFYTLRPPPAFNVSRVLCGEVYRPKFQQPWWTIFRGNLNWVVGDFFLAVRDVMKAFVLEYRQAVTSFLQHKESGVEQQVLYAMYTDSGRALVKPEVELQVLSSPDWFDVGYLCLQAQNSSP